VATTALVGAGMVAMVAAASMPNTKASDASTPNLSASNTSVSVSRQTTLNEASRSTTRVAGAPQTAALKIWLLPMTTYTVGAPFGNTSALDKGVDLNAPEGTPFYAAHGGTVTLARWNGAYGYTVIIDAGNGVQLVYGHASRLFVQEGQTVNSGDLLALTGNTGYSADSSVRFEIRVNGKAVNPISFLTDNSVDLVHHKDSLVS
jgi:murein DD-endopeptidase MepM/ murein hydrolase activator NlpD